MTRLIAFCIAFLSSFAVSAPQDHGVDYGIVYVRYPKTQVSGGIYVQIPQGENPYSIDGGADLMLLNPDGTEDLLVDCDNTCSVMDPYISYDGTTVYYSKILDINLYADQYGTPGYIYKIVLTGGSPYTEVQLTYPGTFDDTKYSGNDTAPESFSDIRGIRDMSPVPLSDGRILFTSNRSGLVTHDVGMSTFQYISLLKNSVQQMYVMDDHDGSRNTVELANIERLDNNSLTMVQHPMQLKDGRILFSGWNNFGEKFNYSMMTTFTIHPDGSNMQQFTEPHEQNKAIDHFLTQLSNDDVVIGQYYPSYDFGYGILVAYPPQFHNGDFLRGAFQGQDLLGGNFSSRDFDRPNSRVLTPNTIGGDTFAPNRNGKYSMPAWAKNNGMLVSYSPGYVNYRGALCGDPSDPYPGDSECEPLKSGIYLHKNATTTTITDHTDSSQLAVMIDDSNYNEIWPRAVVPYTDVFGQSAPDIIPSVRETVSSKYLGKGEPAAIVGTSSMLIKESTQDTSPHYAGKRRETYAGEWAIQGTDVGVFTDSDVYGVRILATPELPFTEPLSLNEPGVYAHESRIAATPARWTSTHHESWEIIGEFPLSHKTVTDPRGNPDTSWWAKIPADTPTTIQAIDVNGMTLYSETVWRSLKPGEQRTDCNGCHAHSVDTQPMDWELGQAGQGAPISGVSGVSDTDERITQGFWDLTTGTIPLIAEGGGVEWLNTKSYDVEYYRDIDPILQAKCSSCHTAGQSNGGLILDDGNAYVTLADPGYTVRDDIPIKTRYIRSPQARQSLLVWVGWGQRLDGRTNGTDAQDFDYPDAHPASTLTFEEKRKLARWVDLGAPANFVGYENSGFAYTDDNQLPVVEIFSPSRGQSPINHKIRAGVTDAQSGVDWTTLAINYYDVSSPNTVLSVSTYSRDDAGMITADIPSLTIGNDYVMTVSVDDLSGNTNDLSVRFTAQAAVTLPAQVGTVGVSAQ